jgi:adenylate cyclase
VVPSPTQPADDDVDLLQRRRRKVVLNALRVAGGTLAMLGLVCMVFAALGFAVLQHVHLLVAAVTASVGTLWGLAVFVAARRRLDAVASGLVVMSVFVPGIYFLGLSLLEPEGAASGLWGPVPFLYAVIVAVSGMLLRPVLSLVAGALAACQLVAIEVSASTLIAGLTLPAPFAFEAGSPIGPFFRVIFLFGVGCASAVTAKIAERLLYDMLAEQRELLSVSRLFGQFVSTEVKNKILRDRTALTEERRTVAVVFSDVRGFTAWTETTDPSIVVAHLNEYFSVMVDAIEAEGGVVDKFIGDAVMATFGGVLPLQAPAAAALRASMRMREALHGLNHRWVTLGKPALTTGIGVAFGPVVLGPLGSDRRRELTVIGDPVNTAARLEALTKEMGHDVIVGASVLSALSPGHGFSFVDLGLVLVKGKADAVHAWALAEGTQRSPDVASRQGEPG